MEKDLNDQGNAILCPIEKHGLLKQNDVNNLIQAKIIQMTARVAKISVIASKKSYIMDRQVVNKGGWSSGQQSMHTHARTYL
jgi:hypothetical protein